MAALDSLERLPPWALYGGAGLVVGGGYLLYKKHKAAAAGTAPSTAMSALSAYSSPASLSGQQSSVVPYYLTDQAGIPASTTLTQRRPIQTIPAGIPSATGVSSPTTLPDIPPILPVNPPAAPTPSAPAAPAPAPGGSNNIPADLLRQIQAGGEQIIGQLAAPGGGVWWLGSKGGIFAEGGAPFFGSARPYGFDDSKIRSAIAIQPLGKGYRIISSRGENYDFNG